MSRTNHTQTEDTPRTRTIFNLSEPCCGAISQAEGKPLAGQTPKKCLKELSTAISKHVHGYKKREQSWEKVSALFLRTILWTCACLHVFSGG